MKNPNLLKFAGCIVLSFGILGLNGFGQSKVVSGGGGLIQSFKAISLAPIEKKRQLISELADVDKARLVRFHLALAAASRKSLTSEQEGIIADAIALTTVDTYREETATPIRREISALEKRARLRFKGKEVFDLFVNFGLLPSKIGLLDNYASMTEPQFSTDRGARFARFGPSEKSNLVKMHLAEEIANRSLTREQILFTLQVITKISPAIYDPPNDGLSPSQRNDAVSYVEENVLTLFKKPDAAEIFASLGGRPGQSPTPNSVPVCSCSTDSDYCSWWRGGSGCVNGNLTCAQANYCGTLGAYVCDGFCNIN